MDMKQMISVMILSALATVTFAQNTIEDKKQIEAGVDALIKSWNNHDYADLKDYATADCEWVNIVGMWWKNRDEVQYAHDAFHKSMFKNTALSKNQITIRFVTPDVAIVHLDQHIGAYTTPNGHEFPEADNLTTLVFVKKEEKWLMTAGQNVVVDAMAQKNDPAKSMVKHYEILKVPPQYFFKF